MQLQDILDFYKYSVESGEKRTQFDGIRMVGKNITDIELRCVDWGNSDFSKTVFVGCDLRGSDFSSAKMYKTRLIHCKVFDCKLPQDSGIQVVNCDHNAISRLVTNGYNSHRKSLRTLQKMFLSAGNMNPVNLSLVVAMLSLVVVILIIIRLT